VKLKQSIASGLDTFAANIKNPDRNSNIGKAFFDVYVWQEIAAAADKKEKEAWKAAQLDGDPIQTDDALRAFGVGEHIASESNKFSCVITVASRKTFDQEKFVTEVSRRWKVPIAKLRALVEECKKPSTQLTKKILEA
jgi:hypothetical protein